MIRLSLPRADARLTLFACLLAAQAGVIAAGPVLADLATDLDVSTAAAGQLRTAAGVAATVTSALVGVLGRRLGAARQLLLGASLVAVGAVASALSPGYAALLAAQLPIGAGVALLHVAATLAAATWVPVEERTRTLSWALVGPPAAWLVGMPLVGVVGATSWRLAFVALPLAAALAAVTAVLARRQGPDVDAVEQTERPASALRSVLGDAALARFLAAELLASSAWVGSLVFAGALLVEHHGASTRTAGFLLAPAAVGFATGTFAGRRLVRHEPHRTLTGLALALGAAEALTWIAAPGAVSAALLLTVTSAFAGSRTLVASSRALDDAARRRAVLTGLRVATAQLGYVVGSVAGGLALPVGGYPALGVVFATMLVGAALLLPRRRASRLRLALQAVAR